MCMEDVLVGKGMINMDVCWRAGVEIDQSCKDPSLPCAGGQLRRE